jgi:hypothetical protein
MLLQVKRAEWLENYKLHVEFNDDSEGEVDLKKNDVQ